MSDGTPVSRLRDALMLANLREWRARLAPTSLDESRWSACLTIDELDMFLRMAAERDALKAAACEMPDERISNVTPIGREAKIHGEFVTMRVDEWRRVTDELSRLRTAEAARIDAALEEDERVIAWKQIADHPFFRECYGTKTSLLEAMLAKLTDSTFTAEIPAEVRERAWVHSAHAARHGHPGEPCRDRSACYPGDRSTEPVHSGAVPENCVPRPKPTFTKTCARCNGRGGLPYEGPCSDCLGTGSTPA